MDKWQQLEQAQRRANIGGIMAIVGALMIFCAVCITSVAVNVPSPAWLAYVVMALAFVGFPALFVGAIIVIVATIRT